MLWLSRCLSCPGPAFCTRDYLTRHHAHALSPCLQYTSPASLNSHRRFRALTASTPWCVLRTIAPPSARVCRCASTWVLTAVTRHEFRPPCLAFRLVGRDPDSRMNEQTPCCLPTERVSLVPPVRAHAFRAPPLSTRLMTNPYYNSAHSDSHEENQFSKLSFAPI